jgi:hypothetical protein
VASMAIAAARAKPSCWNNVISPIHVQLTLQACIEALRPVANGRAGQKTSRGAARRTKQPCGSGA